MVNPRDLREGMHFVGAVDWKRRLFDELIPIPDGTSYNAYAIRGSSKLALIDTVDPTMENVLIDSLNQLETKSIDYVVINHAEQDHSGALPRILKTHPEAKAVATPKCQTMLADLLLIPRERVITVEDGKTVSLGQRTLQFIHAPWVHWPETMLTYLREDKILFSCDLFGSHLATSDLWVTDEATIYGPAKRYYAEIMMPFRRMIEKHLERLKEFEIDVIAPSHGPIYDKPESILGAYRHWVLDPPENLVVLPYVSMHGSTKQMVDHLTEALVERGVAVKRFDLPHTDIGELAMALVDAATLVLAAPTVLTGAHPAALHAAHLASALNPKVRFIAIIGSYGWGGKTVEQLKEIISGLKAELLGTVICKGLPGEEGKRALDSLANAIREKHKEL